MTSTTPTKRAVKKTAAPPEMVEAIIVFTGDLALPQARIRTATGLEDLALSSFGVRNAMREMTAQLLDQGFRPTERLWNVEDLDEGAVTGTIRRMFRRG